MNCCTRKRCISAWVVCSRCGGFLIKTYIVEVGDKVFTVWTTKHRLADERQDKNRVVGGYLSQCIAIVEYTRLENKNFFIFYFLGG